LTGETPVATRRSLKTSKTLRLFLLLFYGMLRHFLLIALLLAAPCFAWGKDRARIVFKRRDPFISTKAARSGPRRRCARCRRKKKLGSFFGIKVLAQFLNDADPKWIQLRDNVLSITSDRW